MQGSVRVGLAGDQRLGAVIPRERYADSLRRDARVVHHQQRLLVLEDLVRVGVRVRVIGSGLGLLVLEDLRHAEIGE